MIELARIVEHQASLASYRATQDEDRAVQLELLIEATKPANPYLEWHTLIATPFRYAPPHPEARFRPAYGKNIFYGSCVEETALYEHAYHFMKQRRHLNLQTETGVRSIFAINADDQAALHIQNHKNMSAIIDKNDYTASHEFMKDNADTTFIIYPSCRDPQHRDNAAVLDIQHLDKNPPWEKAIKFFYDNEAKKLLWMDYKLHITWAQVS